MKKIDIYTTPYCPFCKRAKSLLSSKNASYNEIDLSQEPEKFEEMIEKSNGAKTVPQIFVNDKHIGDCDFIHNLDSEGKLDDIIGK